MGTICYLFSSAIKMNNSLLLKVVIVRGRVLMMNWREKKCTAKGWPYPLALFSSSLFLFQTSLSSIPAVANSSQRSTFITFQVLLTLVLRGFYNIEPILNRTVSLKTFPNLEMLYYIQYSTGQGVPWICWCSFSKYNWVSAEKHLDCSWLVLMASWGNKLQDEKEDK